MSAVDHPNQDEGDGTYEAINVIEAWKLTFNTGNAAKYICRAGKKDSTKYIEDLKKAIWYLQREIKLAGCEPNCVIWRGEKL